MLTLLLTSVSSLVGQNLLDALDFRAFPRREYVRVIGLSTEERHPNNQRCDAFYMVPPTAQHEVFTAKLAEICAHEQPDFCLPGRDRDAYALARLQAEQNWVCCPFGAPETVLYTLDKALSWTFCAERHLPFAHSLVLEPTADPERLRAFGSQHGYPLIAKPQEGYASIGVHFVRDHTEALALQSRGGYLFQEYLGQPDELDAYFASLSGPPPLFAHPQTSFHYTCQVYVSRQGQMSEIFVSLNHHQMGQTVRFEQVSEPQLEALTRQTTQALIEAGFRGPLAIQCRQDRHGHWKILEMNARTNGNTEARLYGGYDELGLMLRDHFPDSDFPLLPELGFGPGYVLKGLVSQWVSRA